MKNVTIIGWASMLFLLLFTSCRENTFEPDTKITIPEPVVNVIASAQGRVVDADQNAIAGATIQMGSLTIASDEYGYFQILDKQMNKNGTLITATQNGYFLGAKMFNPSLGQKSFVKFQLIEKVLTGSFTATTGGTVSTTDNATVSFGANSVMYDNGAAYNGEVQVYAKWLNPDERSTVDEMPGDLRALDTDEDIVQLATYGMMAVELETPSGQALQVAEGSKATLKFPIAESQKSTAPTTIPLWSFDEDNGYWIEESSATLANGFYEGEVSHFSFWNCDAPFPIVLIDGTVKYSNGEPAANYKVEISMVSNPATVRYGFTSSEGHFGGKMPKDELLNIAVYNNCDEPEYTAQIGPFSVETTIADIVIDDLNLVIVTGSLQKCDGTPVTNGYALINGEGYDDISLVDATGAFTAAINLCEDGTLTIKAYDLDDLVTAPEIVVDASAAGGNLDLGVISLCDELDEYINISVDQVMYANLVIEYNLAAGVDSFFLSTGNTQDTVSLFLGLEGTVDAPGTYNTQSFNFSDWTFTENGNDWGLYLNCGQTMCPTTEITLFEGSGGYVEGTFSGTVEVNENPTHTELDVEIEFRLKID